MWWAKIRLENWGKQMLGKQCEKEMWGKQRLGKENVASKG